MNDSLGLPGTYPASLLEMFEKTPTTLLDMLGSAIITAIAIRTSITAYSTVVTPFRRLRFASDTGSVVSLFSIFLSNSIQISSP